MNTSKVKKFTVDGTKYKISWNYNGKSTKSKVFVDCKDLAPEFEEALESVAKEVGASTVYTKTGDFPKLDKAWKVFNREEVKVHREALEGAKAKGFVKYSKAIFSKKAGCGCGCSPGFTITGDEGRNFHIEVA